MKIFLNSKLLFLLLILVIIIVVIVRTHTYRAKKVFGMSPGAFEKEGNNRA